METLSFATLFSDYFDLLSILLLHSREKELWAWTALNNAFTQMQDKCFRLAEDKPQGCLFCLGFPVSGCKSSFPAHRAGKDLKVKKTLHSVK